MWFRKRKPDPTAAVRELRERIFVLPPEEVGLAPTPGGPAVWTVFMETGFPEAVASLLVVADGTTSLYFSNGGGIIGAGEHESVRAAATAFLAAANEHLGELAPATEHPLPDRGRVRFYLRTFTGLLTAEASENDLGENRHPLSPLFHAGHVVITAIRVATPDA